MRHRLVVLPAKLFPQIRSKPWTSVGIPNAYRGFAIIGRKRRDVVSGQTAHRDSGSLKTLAHILANPQTRINAFEEESGHFVRYLLQWAKVSSPDKQIKVTAPLKARFNLALDPMFTALVKDECDFALGTAPSRALAEQAGFEVFADFEALIHVLDEPLRQKANALALHEVWAVDLPPEAEGPLMRLASLLLYTVEYVRSKPEEFVRFLYNEALKATADGAYLLQRQFVRKAVSSCYSYAPSEEYFFEYLTPLSGSHHKHTGKRGPAHIFGQLMQYRAECDSLLAKIASLSQVDLSVREHIERATRHYQIFNYYDACQSLQRVARTLGAE